MTSFSCKKRCTTLQALPAWLARKAVSLSGSRRCIFIQFFVLFSAHTSWALHPFHREFTLVECRDRLVEPILSTDEPPVLMIGGNCSCFRANPAHFVGHLPSRFNITADVYSHVFPSMLEGAMDKWDSFFADNEDVN